MAKALRHDGSGGAPNAPIQLQRWVDDKLVTVPGLYRPDRPTPVGGDGQLSLDLAQELDADQNCPLELVDVSDSEIKDLEDSAKDEVEVARSGAVKARREASTHESKARVNDLTKGVGK